MERAAEADAGSTPVALPNFDACFRGLIFFHVMKVKTPPGYPVLIPFENSAAFEKRPWRRKGVEKTRASAELAKWMKEECGPLGVLWNVQRGVDGWTFYFVRHEHAVHAKLRWGLVN